jgi:hypothetical protein
MVGLARENGGFGKMAKGKKTGGRRRGTPNRITAELRQQALATGKSMLQIMTDNAREMDAIVQKLSEQLAKASGDDLIRLIEQILVYRDRAQRYARDAAPFFHPQLADIKHDHRSADGKGIRPVIEITGYPGSKEIAPPTRPALPPPDDKD